MTESDLSEKPEQAAASAEPAETGVTDIAQVRPTVPAGLGAQIIAVVRYLMQTEVHTYAFSVAANAILSLFPLIVLVLALSRFLFHSRAMESLVAELLRSFLPTGQDFVMRNMQLLAYPRRGIQAFSLFMLLVTSTGVFLPLEVALNNVWGVRRNRNYLQNQLISLGLAVVVGVLALTSVAITAGDHSLLPRLFFGHTQNAVFQLLNRGAMRLFGLFSAVLLFFLVYWILPNRSIPAAAVLPTAVIVGVLWEAAKFAYVRALPWLDFQAIYGPFYITVGLMMWAFLSGLLLLAGAHFSATRYSVRATREMEADKSAKATHA